VGEAIIGTLFGPGENGRIPIVAITGTHGKTAVTRLVAHVLHAVYRHVGVTSSHGALVNDTLMEPGDCSGPRNARALFAHPQVDAAVLETSAAGILRGGLAFDLCDVGVVTNIGAGDFTGLEGIDSPERIVWIKRCVVDGVTPQTGMAVLNALDPLVAAMAEYSRGKVIYFADAAQNPVTDLHRNAGGRCVLVRDEQILLVEGEREETLAPLAAIAAARGGEDRQQVQNVLAAVGALWALSIPLNVIRERLRSFQPAG
jgi:cyanophycin synthetase